jgi:hypothetical protein
MNRNVALVVTGLSRTAAPSLKSIDRTLSSSSKGSAGVALPRRPS